MLDSDNLDLSFSGLKTAVANLVSLGDAIKQHDLCASIEQAIVDTLVKKTIKALLQTKAKTLILGGGVASNEKLRLNLQHQIQNTKYKIHLHIPQKPLCTDNAAMIAAAAFFLKPANPLKIQANPNLSLAY